MLNLLVLRILTAGVFFCAPAAFAMAAYAVGVLVVVSIVGGSFYPDIVQRFIVAPNEIDKERPYISNSIEFTRKAYGLDHFEERSFSAVEDLTLDDIHQNEATFRNVRLWDHKPLLTTFAQLQEIRTYYDFVHIDNDRYWINGIYRQVSLSPRELNSDSLNGHSWINEHLTYTHGYGLCLGPVNEFTSEGLPVLFIKNIPPASNIPITITRPEIYYGELGNDYCFVKTPFHRNICVHPALRASFDQDAVGRACFFQSCDGLARARVRIGRERRGGLRRHRNCGIPPDSDRPAGSALRQARGPRQPPGCAR